MAFDVSIDLTEAILPPGASIPDRAANLVAAVVSALPGAEWVSVDVCAVAPSGFPG